MGKVVRSNKAGVQKIRAKGIVPGDIVEISGEGRLALAEGDTQGGGDAGTPADIIGV